MKTGENSLKGTPSIMRFTQTRFQVRYIDVSLPTGCKPCSGAGGGFGSQRSSWGSTCEENEICEIFSHIGTNKNMTKQLKNI